MDNGRQLNLIIQKCTWSTSMINSEFSMSQIRFNTKVTSTFYSSNTFLYIFCKSTNSQSTDFYERIVCTLIIICKKMQCYGYTFIVYALLLMICYLYYICKHYMNVIFKCNIIRTNVFHDLLFWQMKMI